ncbi:MAG: superoxide dismutase [Lentisphaerota bacterium]
MAHVLAPLPYPNSALEPHLDARTTEIHHDKHHAAYINNLNAALEKHPELFSKSLEDLLADLKSVPEDIRTAVRNNAGGAANHNLYWELMSPQGGGKPTGALAAAINKTFGGFDAFKEKFSKTAAAQFASGWGWLYVDPKGQLAICSTPGHDSPLMQGVVATVGKPVLVVDVWEHAYYLKFQNKRADFIATWWNVINWPKAEELYAKAIRA